QSACAPESSTSAFQSNSAASPPPGTASAAVVLPVPAGGLTELPIPAAVALAGLDVSIFGCLGPAFLAESPALPSPPPHAAQITRTKDSLHMIRSLWFVRCDETPDLPLR